MVPAPLSCLETRKVHKQNTYIIFSYTSAKYEEVSANDVPLKEPKVQNDLFGLLLRFCCNPVAVICYIMEMYEMYLCTRG